ncbi:MAG: type II secretion system protein GspD [Gammaproteobacteria bacterium]|nr:type II secretion system protein GspD [Gammaproteobacteria bacterium]
MNKDARWVALLRWAMMVVIYTGFFLGQTGFAEGHKELSLSLQNVDITEVMEMLSRNERVNILLTKGVEGEVSVNLYDVTVDQAIRSIADAAGYAVEFRAGSYFVLKREDSGKYATSGITELRTLKVEYSNTDVVEGILTNYLSEYGQMTTLPERKLLVVEDLPEFIDRIEELLKELDRQPKQILIEAKILEITLQDSESFGIKWAKFFNTGEGAGSFGTRGLANPISPGLFIDVVTPNVEVFLDALRSRDRLRTLSTPKLLALEHQEAEAIIGDRIGYRVTTTINQVTTESIEFLESGVILKIKPSVDGQGRILLNVHPEVSTGTVSDDGIPSLKTTEVTTQMLVEDSQTVFIGGLIKRTLDQSRDGVPILGDLPIIGRLFSNKSSNNINFETVVLITPYIVDDHHERWNTEPVERAEEVGQELDNKAFQIDAMMSERRQEVDSKKPAQTPARPLDPYFTMQGDW